LIQKLEITGRSNASRSLLVSAGPSYAGQVSLIVTEPAQTSDEALRKTADNREH
jgi:hypothetical protein